MAVDYRTFYEDLKANELNYSDEFFKLKGEKVIPSDSFTFDSYQALKNVNDFKTNNYSNLFLTSKQQNTNWLQAKLKYQDGTNGLATTISWYSNDSQNQQQPGYWLYFAKNYQMFDINVSEVQCMVTYGKPSGNQPNYIFYLELIDDNTCRISHTFGDLVFYLVVEDDGKTVHFSKEIDGKKQVFVYNLDDGLLKLFKRIQHPKKDQRDQIVGWYNKLYILMLDRGQSKLTLTEQLNDQSSNSLIYVNQNQLMFDYYMDGSWVGYDRNKYISSINQDKSSFTLKTQSLLHHQFNKGQGINFIPLKNNLTYKGNSIRGNNTNNSDIDYPDVDYRTYSSINSGYNQQFGNDNIILTFTFVDQQYQLNQGQDLIFTIPQKSLDGTNMLQPLWPYKYINLNDTKFVKNGAFGSDVPYFSDKIKKLQTHKTSAYKQDGSRLTPNNQTYLCSWLYKPYHQAQPVWLDRYYYPDFITRSEALRGEMYSPSFQNIIDKNYISELYQNSTDIKSKIHKLTYFDKYSDLLIQPGNTYSYSRVSDQSIQQINQKSENNKIAKCINQSNKIVELQELIQFNNQAYRKIDYKQWKGTNSINFNADFYLQRGKRMGMQIFGNDYNSGLTIQNRKDVTPYHYYATDKVVYLLNNKMQIVHQFDLYQKYEDYILKLFLGDVFDDIIVLSGTWMYILSYDLILKSRIDLTAQSDQDNAIKGLKDIVLEQGVSLLNYPYGHNGVQIESSFVKNSDIVQIQQSYTDIVDIEQKIISIDKILFGEVKTSGSVKIPSVLCSILCKQHPLLYKNNIYVPVGQNIMKIIMCPDCQKDFDIFDQEERQSYPAVARLLHSSQYYLNYKKTNNSQTDKQKLGVQSGFIQVQKIIKRIYINQNGEIYGFNFDNYAVSSDGDTIYGLYSWDKYIKSGGWWWIFNQSLSKMKSDINSSKYAQWASPNSIDKLKINQLGQMCLIRNFNNTIDNKNPDNNKRLEVYDKTKSLVYQYDLSLYEKVLTLDTFNIINQAHQQQTCFCALCSAYGFLYKVVYSSSKKDVVARRVDIPIDICQNFDETINSNAILRYGGKNVLYFNLHVPSRYTYDYVATIKWDLQDIQDGWYNINVQVDLQKAQFIVRVNDNIHQIISQQTHPWFKPFQSANGTTFTNSFYFGIIGKRYGTTLNNLLKNSPYDPYACKNLMIDRAIIHNRRLSYHQYLAMRMRYSKVNRLILTLPCGNRSNIDQMIRYFKYNASPAISNKVKINISGTGLKTSGQFDMLRKEIMQTLNNNTDCLMTIKDIQFIENE